MNPAQASIRHGRDFSLSTSLAKEKSPAKDFQDLERRNLLSSLLVKE
jgi:hypothetical protein